VVEGIWILTVSGILKALCKHIKSLQMAAVCANIAIFMAAFAKMAAFG
jgi:hypothetical protein